MKYEFPVSIFVFFLSFSLFAQDYPTPVEGDYVIDEFEFESGEKLENLNLHYTTLGEPTKGEDGKVNNAILIKHGTTGTGHQFLSSRYAGNLFGPGQTLDATKYFIILTDDIGHGKSSKPSDSLRMEFPKYTYDDMVLANYKLLTEHLKVDHLRLVTGTSMGGMQSWVWGYTYPDFMDAIMPLASLPVEIAGRNRMQRAMIVKLIEMDPEWKNGNYKEQPKVGLSGAIGQLMFMVSSPLQWQKRAPTREEAEEMLDNMVERYLSIMDANDMIYAFESSRNYNPAPHLSKIKAPLIAINSADDQVNPPELGLMEEHIQKIANAKFVLLPITDETSGHGTHSNPAIWGNYLEELMAISAKK
ncbi:homoserine O-acetyltransferase [Gillisia sp. Hel_I_86]|uniref:alpha/beta fold hydrolase n=1 Tax=Gillisia sp. Hel_I_86 TaxID=1249981 RepID=UPI00119ACA04|nr:alpha/beta fold hydrolase [Gillisia sp. Hel_I_86]TVZ26028.1 homoserine O-acetyltransferase [Gillisia sp. Hel_I_86]